jgi:hypothetical protein
MERPAFHTIEQNLLAETLCIQMQQANCTGWLDSSGRIFHDGDTCPIHENDDD